MFPESNASLAEIDRQEISADQLLPFVAEASTIYRMATKPATLLVEFRSGGFHIGYTTFTREQAECLVYCLQDILAGFRVLGAHDAPAQT